MSSTEESTAAAAEPVLARDGGGPGGTTDAPASEGGGHKGSRSFWRELPVLVIVAVGLAVLIKTFFLQAFYIPSGSMENTLLIGDRVLVNKLVTHVHDPRRGQIVVFNGTDACKRVPDGVANAKPCNWPNVQESANLLDGNALQRGLRDVQDFIGLGSRNEHDFIKRVIGVAGDTVSCPAEKANSAVCDAVVVDGKALDENSFRLGTTGPFDAVTVPKGTLWVMGDNREGSSDSRSNGFVAVPSVVGRAFVTVWPPSRFGGHGIPKTFDQGLDPTSARALGVLATPPAAGLVGALPLVALRRRRLVRRARRGSTAAPRA